MFLLELRILKLPNRLISAHENSTTDSTKMKTTSRNILICQDAKSPYYIAQFTAPGGNRVRRSTKVPVAGGIFQGERLNAAMAKKRALLIAHQLAAASEEEYTAHDNRTVRDLFDIMLAGKLGRVSIQTYRNAATDYKIFCQWLGARANQPARLITKADIKEWVIARRSLVRARTVHKGLNAIRAAFSWAEDAGIITRNPCADIKVPPDTRDERITHEAFTLDEIRTLIDKLPDEWSAAVRCCIGTYGQRLGDILTLRWEQFDWTARTVRITTGKTARQLLQPMQDDFYAWARARHDAALLQGGDAAVYVMPTLQRNTSASRDFTQLVRFHGIGLKGADAGGNRRTWHSKTFHSLRASVATMLQESGVPQGMAMQLVGHDSADVHSVYIRPTAAQLRDAAARLPHL